MIGGHGVDKASKQWKYRAILSAARSLRRRPTGTETDAYFSTLAALSAYLR